MAAKKIKLSTIKPNPANPRICKDDRFQKLCNSIEQFPKMMALRPIIIDNNSMILGGNMRYKALLHLKYKEVPETWIKSAGSLTEAEKKEFIIKDNIGFGSIDKKKIEDDWSDLPLEEWGLELMSDGYFQKMTKEIEEMEIKLPYPITLVVNEQEYNQWEKVKSELNEPSDFKAFMILFKKMVKKD